MSKHDENCKRRRLDHPLLCSCGVSDADYLAVRFPHTFKPKVWHKDGPVGQVRAMADWVRREANPERVPNQEMLGKIERNLREAADSLAGQLAELEGLREALQAANDPERCPGKRGHG